MKPIALRRTPAARPKASVSDLTADRLACDAKAERGRGSFVVRCCLRSSKGVMGSATLARAYAYR